MGICCYPEHGPADRLKREAAGDVRIHRSSGVNGAICCYRVMAQAVLSLDQYMERVVPASG